MPVTLQVIYLVMHLSVNMFTTIELFIKTKALSFYVYVGFIQL